MTNGPEGLDTDALRAWLDDAAPGLLGGSLEATLITGGKSNLTYVVTDGTTDVVVRRPPLGHVLATAHDMGREYRAMAALAGSVVPVPTTYGLCEDPDVIGAPFYVMERVPGTPYKNAVDLEPLGADRVHDIALRLIDTLATLHSVDYREVGLAEHGRPDGFLERQVRRWTKQLEASRSRDLDGIDELGRRLAAAIPAASDATIVHGDYRLDNVLVDSDAGDRITAVLDWEMSTLGDPLTDVALMLSYQEMGEAARDAGETSTVADAPLAPGYPSSDDVLARYAATSGRDVSDIGWHMGLAYFKLAVILEGIYFRFSQGKTLGEGFDSVGAAVPALVHAGLRATD